MCRSGGSGGKYLLPHHAAGGACVAPGGRVVGIFSTIVPPEERVSFRGGPGGEYLVCGKYLAFGKCLAFPGSPGWCRVSSLFGMGLTHFVSMGYQVFYFS